MYLYGKVGLHHTCSFNPPKHPPPRAVTQSLPLTWGKVRCSFRVVRDDGRSAIDSMCRESVSAQEGPTLDGRARGGTQSNFNRPSLSTDATRFLMKKLPT